MVTFVNRSLRYYKLFHLHIPFFRRSDAEAAMRRNEEDLDPSISTSMGALNVETRDDNLINALRLEY